MSVEYSLKNLKKRFDSEKSILPNTYDKKNLNALIRYFNNQNKQFEVRHLNFLKVYIIALRGYLIRYPNVEVASRELHREMDLGFDKTISEFTELLNHITLENFEKKIGLNTPVVQIKPITTEQEQENIKLLQEYQGRYFELLKGHYTVEKVKQKLIEQAHQAIVNF